MNASWSSEEEVFATQTAFAALRSTGDVVVWGDAQCGGDARAVQERSLGGARGLGLSHISCDMQYISYHNYMYNYLSLLHDMSFDTYHNMYYIYLCIYEMIFFVHINIKLYIL